MAEQIRSWIEARKRYRIVVYSLGLVSFSCIVFVFAYQAILAHKQEALVSAVFDGPFFETSKLVLGAIFGGALVGIIFDGFQSKVLNAENNFVSTMVREGIVDVFANDRDPRFIEWLSVNISGAKSEISIVGLGMGFLVHNRDLMVEISNRVKKQKSLRVSFYIGASSSAGVMNRAEEEAAWHERNKLAYDPSWIDRYASEIFTTIKKGLSATHLRRVKFRMTKSQPTLCIVKIDDCAVYYPYGPPSIRGSQSPWTQISLGAKAGHLGSFIKDALEFYTENDNSDEFIFF